MKSLPKAHTRSYGCGLSIGMVNLVDQLFFPEPNTAKGIRIENNSAFESEIDKILETRLKSSLRDLRIDQN
jgi:hypothetical protein